MNDIEFIKKSIPFADGFRLTEYENNEAVLFEKDGMRFIFRIVKNKDISEWFICPHFLTRTIEGINRGKSEWEIDIYSDSIEVNKGQYRMEYITDLKDIDTAKRSAIEYVLERL